ncbi:DNA/RNA non-specific endonuclease [Trinorchestia longiramus]|nr:DNA/RNA non-specific endonuclease [Trinorchestia longiramus]
MGVKIFINFLSVYPKVFIVGRCLLQRSIKMMFLKFAVFILLVVTCLAQPQAHGRQLAGSSALTIDCNDQAAVAEAVRTNADFRCDTQALRASFKKCPEVAADCSWDKDTEYPTKYPPMLFSIEQERSVLPVLVGTTRMVKLSDGEEVIVTCPDTEITVLQQEAVSASCTSSNSLLIDGQASDGQGGSGQKGTYGEYDMAELGCTSRPKESLQKDLGPCGEGGDTHQIGFEIQGYGFYPLITVCFDPVLETTLYSYNIVRGANIEAKDVNPDRPGFKTGSGFFTVSANTCYEQDSQIALMDTLLGDSSVIDVSKSYYFSRGHMAPDADFVTEQEEDATYYYINALPQWQSFNNGNWRHLETSVRDLAASRGSDIEVWSGGWQVLQLDDINGNPVDIFLGLTQGEAVIPAADVTWKVVYDASTDNAAAVVGVNNPYLTSAPDMLCEGSLCEELTWLTGMNVSDYTAGAMYCCAVQDLAVAIPNVPDLGSAGLLTS